MMYLVALPAVKIAILLTYLRIFQQKNFRMLVYGALGLNAAYAIIFVLVTAFQCTPINLVSWCQNTLQDVEADWISGVASLGQRSSWTM